MTWTDVVSIVTAPAELYLVYSSWYDFFNLLEIRIINIRMYINNTVYNLFRLLVLTILKILCYIEGFVGSSLHISVL